MHTGSKCKGYDQLMLRTHKPLGVPFALIIADHSIAWMLHSYQPLAARLALVVLHTQQAFLVAAFR